MHSLRLPVLDPSMFQRDENSAGSFLLHRAVCAMQNSPDRGTGNECILSRRFRIATTINQFLCVRPYLRTVNRCLVVRLITAHVLKTCAYFTSRDVPSTACS